MKKLCLIIPCYNEQDRINQRTYVDFIKSNTHIDFYFSNDGSTDKTYEVLKDMTKEIDNAFVLDFGKNFGKAGVIRQSVLHLKDKPYDLLGFWDADLATPLEEIDGFLNVFKNNYFLCVMGTRILRLGTSIKRKAMRHYLGRVFATIVSMMLKLPVYDTQCGAKIFKKDVATKIFGEEFVSMWFFDVELLFRIKREYKIDVDNSNIYELPLETWHDIAGSKLKFTDFLKTPLELLKIFKKYCL